MFFCHFVRVAKVAEESFAFPTKADLDVVPRAACATEQGCGPDSKGVGRVSAQFELVSEIVDDTCGVLEKSCHLFGCNEFNVASCSFEFTERFVGGEAETNRTLNKTDCGLDGAHVDVIIV